MYDSTYQTTMSDGTGAAVGLAFLLFTLVLGVAAYALTAFFLSKVFKKAGVQGWIAWVPFYNTWKLLEMGDQKGFWAVLTIVPIVNIASAVFTIIAMYHIGIKFGKDGVFVLLAIFVPIVWIVWLALDAKAVWQSGAPVVPTTTPTPLV